MIVCLNYDIEMLRNLKALSIICTVEVVGHPPAPLHEGQWPK